MTRTRCEIFSRVVGYMRPVSNWHESKQQEFKDRKLLNVNKALNDENID